MNRPAHRWGCTCSRCSRCVLVAGGPGNVVVLPTHVNTATALPAVVSSSALPSRARKCAVSGSEAGSTARNQSATNEREASQTKPKKKKKVQLARSPAVLDCAVLCIDAGETSGHAAWDRTNLRWFGEVDVFGEGPKEVLERFLELSGPHVLVVERPFQVQYANQTGIGTADAIWRQLARRMGFSKRIVRVVASRWRAVSLGKGWGSAGRDQARERELEMATALVKRTFVCRVPVVGPDAAAAIMMGPWALQAGEVLRVLPKARPPSKRALREQQQLRLATGSEACG